MTAGSRPLSSPVYDPTSGFVFVGDYSGFLNKVSATGVVTRSGQVDFGTGLVAGPIVDSTTGSVFVFSSDSGTRCTGGTAPCAAVYRFGTGFGSGGFGTNRAVGASQAAPPNPNPLYEGGFDSAYLTSGTGNLYVCGNTAGAPTLYRIPVTPGALAAVVAGPPLASATTGCSPVTDVPNPKHRQRADLRQRPGQRRGHQLRVRRVHHELQRPALEAVNRLRGRPGNSGYPLSNSGGQGCRNLEEAAGASRLGRGSRREHERRRDAALDKPGPLRRCTILLGWQATYMPRTAEIVDSNGNVEWMKAGGTSKAGTAPPWSAAVNGATVDGTVNWVNLGAIASFSLATAGGTSGVIMDNTVVGRGLAGLFFNTAQPDLHNIRRIRWLRDAGITIGITIDKIQIGSLMTINDMSSDDPRTPVSKKPYEKPSFRFEQVFVTTALSCGKVGTTQAVRSAPQCVMTSAPQVLDEAHALKCDLAGEVLRSSGTLRLQVMGWSMLPTVLPGDTLVIESAHSNSVCEGDIVLFGRDRRLFAHRVVTKGQPMPGCNPGRRHAGRGFSLGGGRTAGESLRHRAQREMYRPSPESSIFRTRRRRFGSKLDNRCPCRCGRTRHATHRQSCFRRPKSKFIGIGKSLAGIDHRSRTLESRH